MAGDVDLQFTPVPSLHAMFTAGPEIKFIGVLGPIGSTKTTTCLHKLLALAANQAPSPDGIRRSRIAIIRNTLVSLKQTVLKDCLSLFGDIAEWRQQDSTIRFRFADIDSEWIFLSLETPQDQRRLLSLQLSVVYVNEAREVSFELLMASFSRCGRYPSKMHGGVACTQPLLLFDSNMGVKGSALYNFLEVDRHPSLLFIHQPSALSPEADWLQFLREGYYEDLMVGARRAWVETHVHAKWSQDLSGEPIFAEMFDEYIHVARRATPVVTDHGLIIGLDPGLNPAALITQPTANGRLLVHDEVYAENMLFGMFLDEHLTPLVQSRRFVGRRIIVIADPTARTRSATSGVTARGMMQERGYDVQLASTNDVHPRLNVIEQWLSGMRNSAGRQPAGLDTGHAPPVGALLIDPRCTVLIEGLAGEYKYKRKTNGQLETEPMKLHPTSDVMDCFGYAGLGLAIPRNVQRLRTGFKPEGMQQPPPVAAWT